MLILKSLDSESLQLIIMSFVSYLFAILLLNFMLFFVFKLFNIFKDQQDIIIMLS